MDDLTNWQRIWLALLAFIPVVTLTLIIVEVFLPDDPRPENRKWR